MAVSEEAQVLAEELRGLRGADDEAWVRIVAPVIERAFLDVRGKVLRDLKDKNQLDSDHCRDIVNCAVDLYAKAELGLDLKHGGAK